MAVNYGSNSLKTTGDIIDAQGQPSGRTLYFSGGDWASASNWYLDAAKTIQSPSIPTIEDIAIISDNASVTSLGSGSIEAHTIILRDSGSFSLSSITIYAKYISLYESSHIYTNSGNIGNSSNPTEIKFYNDSYISNSVSTLSIYGDVYFYDNADNGGSNGANGITIYGNLYINVQSTGSYGFVTGGTSNTVYGNVYIYNQTTSTTDLLKYCYVYGNLYLQRYAAAAYCTVYGSCEVNSYSAITNSSFYGPSCNINDNSYVTTSNFYGTNSHFTNYSYMGSTNYIYHSECEFSYYSYIAGDNYFYDAITKINYYGYISSGTTYLYDGSKLILNGDTTSGGGVTITGDSNESRIEMYQQFGQNGISTSSSITCGTLALYGDSYLTSINTFNVDKVELYGRSYISSANTLPIVVFNEYSYCNASVTSDTYFQFNDDSYLSSSYTLSGSDSNVYAEFNGNSYNDGTVSCEKVVFNGRSRNSGTVSYDSTFNDYSKNESSCTVSDDAVFNDFSSNEGTVSGDATFTGYSTNTGTVTGSLIYRNVPTLLTPSSISSNQNDYDPGYGDVLRLEASSADRDITGLVLKDRYLIVIVNIGSTYNIILKHEDSNSTAANRFITPTAGDHIIPPGGTVTMLYDSTSTRWRIL